MFIRLMPKTSVNSKAHEELKKKKNKTKDINDHQAHIYYISTESQ